MDRDRWELIQALFHDTADLPPAEQRARLDERCGDDPELRADVLRMLEADAREDTFLGRGLAEVAGDVLADDAMAAVPRTLGPYRLLELLGEGGMGVVYLAERADLESRVAIKILRDAWLSPLRRERFAAEQRTLAMLNHPAIARLYDADVLPGGTPWFAMEYVEGTSITRYCATRECGIPETLRLFREVCEAVLHAHQHAVIHRDLKPSNIMVTRDGRVKLLDFGIAKQLEAGGGPADRTRTAMRLMTPAYAAPEQVRGGELGVFTDVYSLGVLLYELLTGRPPFELDDRSPTDVERILTGPPPPRPSAVARGRAQHPDARRGAQWADLDVLCLTAMQQDPAGRYRSVDSLIRDVERYLAGEPLEARPSTMRYRVGKFVRRNARAVALTGAALMLLMGLVTFYTVRLSAARNAALAEAERTRRIQAFMNSLFEGGDEEAGPADTLRVVTLLARGVQQANALAAQPAVQADLFQTLGGIYGGLGDLARADSLQSAALALRRSRLGPRDPSVARSLVALGLVRSNESLNDDAERLVREGLAASGRAANPDPAAVASATTALGIVLENRGRYDDAIVQLTRAAVLDSLAGVPPAELSATLTELANCHFYAGKYAVSDSLNRRLLEVDRALHGAGHPQVAADLVNLGAIQSEWGHYPQAEQRYREALAIYRAWYGDEHFETAATLTMIGRALIPQGRLDEAAVLLRKALAIRERVYGPDHPNVASTLNELARIAQQQGRLDEAEAGFRRMIRIYEAAYQGKHYLIGTAYSNLGSVYADRGDQRRAEGFYREALRRFGETLPAGHLYTGIARIKLGRALLRQGRYEEAERETRTGYDIVAKQSDPTGTWPSGARADLLAEYEALGRTADAARVRAERAKLDPGTTAAKVR